MGSNEERLVEIAALPVGCRIQQDQQKYAQGKIDRAQANNPCPLPRLHPLVKNERNQADEQVNRIELFQCSADVGPDLFTKHDEICRWMNPLVLPARKRMEEPGDGSWITPVQRRVRHTGERQE